ncbi:MAG: alpha-1,4-glucan--maltose-1-phosphate maltosyltransferase [Acidobacteria bacterium]|nr:alpha-1,4-glucan--maltose-1-phosphate maltosyltransferase [Acidobacteriota bacterium]
MDQSQAAKVKAGAPPRVVIANVRPEVDAGRYPCKATVGDRVVVTANIFADGHDRVAARLRYRHASEKKWTDAPMELINWGVDLWSGTFLAEKLGVYLYTLEGWIDQDRRAATRYERDLRIVVDRDKAAFSAWYEMFPRSWATQAGGHGTFQDCIARLPYVAGMGFDVLYLPPIHPIGRAHRKGKNGSPVAAPGDVGSPWAIGGPEGGHKAIHPELGTLEDFKRLMAAARAQGLEVALELAFHCSPDHPYLKEHPEWFRRRPDGSIRHAENPPKKFEDIVWFDFECADWRGLWEELKSLVVYWAEQGVRIFRVDNPHTKPFAFWEWLVTDVKKDYPDVLFLSEAFTRPDLMYHLAKVGLTQSYTYFAWRNTKAELEEYFTELAQPELRAFFRPSHWPNTPDVLTEYLQSGGRAAFMVRLALAATLGASYGIYGPAFELCENRPHAEDSEEYLNAEKFEIKRWDLGAADSLREFIARVNRARRENPALQRDRNLVFHPTDNEQLIACSKTTDDLSNAILTVVNLDPRRTRWGFVKVKLESLGIGDENQPYQLHDLLDGAGYLWRGPRNYVELDPRKSPAHVFRVTKVVSTAE